MNLISFTPLPQVITAALDGGRIMSTGMAFWVAGTRRGLLVYKSQTIQLSAMVHMATSGASSTTGQPLPMASDGEPFNHSTSASDLLPCFDAGR